MKPQAAAGIITSARHPLAVHIRKLANRPQLARREAVLLLDGIHLIEEALAADPARLRPKVILTAPRFETSAGGRLLLEEMQRAAWPHQRISAALMEHLAVTQTPQGIVGLFERPVWGLEELRPSPSGPSFALLLAGLQDPGNLGMLARTARAFGCVGLMTTAGTTDPYHARALRASSGALLHLPVMTALAPEALTTWASDAGARLVALVAQEGAPPADALSDLDEFILLVLGSEGQGLPREIEDLCEHRFRLPMVAGMDSLGVAAAGSIALFLAGRRSR